MDNKHRFYGLFAPTDSKRLSGCEKTFDAEIRPFEEALLFYFNFISVQNMEDMNNSSVKDKSIFCKKRKTSWFESSESISESVSLVKSAK